MKSNLRKSLAVLAGLVALGGVAYGAAPQTVQHVLADCCDTIGWCCSFMGCCR